MENISKRDHCQWLHSQFIVAFHCVCVLSFHSILGHGGKYIHKYMYKRWNIAINADTDGICSIFGFTRSLIPILQYYTIYTYLITCIFHLSARVGFCNRVGMWNRLMSQFVLFSCRKHVVWEQIALWLYVTRPIFERANEQVSQQTGGRAAEAMKWKPKQLTFFYFPTRPSFSLLSSALALWLAFQYNCIKLSMHYVLERLKSLVCVFLRHIVRFFIHCLHYSNI